MAILVGSTLGCQLTLSWPHPSFLVEAGARLYVWEKGRCADGAGLCMALGVQAITSLCPGLNRYLGVPFLHQRRDSFALFLGQVS